MTKRILCLLLLASILSSSYGQDLIERTQQGLDPNPSISLTQTRIYTDILHQKKSANLDIHNLFTFDESQSRSAAHEQELSKAPVYLKLDVKQLHKLHTERNEIIQLAIPVDDKNQFILTLKAYSCLSDVFDARSNEGEAINYSSVRTFRGFVENEPGSLVSLTISEQDVRILIADYSGNFSVGKLARDGSRFVLLNDDSKLEKKQFTCGVIGGKQLNLNTQNDELKKATTLGCVDIHIEVDYDNYLFIGTAEQTVFSTLSLFNETATVFFNENIDINISDLVVWTTSDPYKNISSTYDVLDAFAMNTQNAFNGDLAHLLMGESRSDVGGIAWLGFLGSQYNPSCTTDTGIHPCGPYGLTTSINFGHSTYPTYSYTVSTLAHELGHNFGSDHTHDCVWNGNNTAIDGCATPVGCANPGSTSNGTIMSYCPSFSLSNGFGSQPGNVIRAGLNNAISTNGIDGTCSCSVPCADDFVLDYFGSVYRSSWGVLHPRLFGDVNGDGMDDIIGFASAGVRVALSSGSDVVLNSGYNLAQYGVSNGWNSAHPRHVVDVNGDGKDDIVGFAASGVFVTTSTGSSFNTPSYWINGYGASSALDVDDNPRVPGDFNNDGLTDFVVFGNTKTVVIESTGTAFENDLAFDVVHFHQDQGWSAIYPRLVGDIDGDGFDDDIVGFGPNAVQAVTSDGTSFSAVSNWTTQFTTSSAGWTPVHHPRFLADVNGDGMDDIVGFANGGVNVGLSTGTSFGPRTLWYPSFGSAAGWNVANHPRYMADINGDGLDDIIGFANQGVFVSLSNGTDFDQHVQISSCYGFFDGWSSASYVRKFADFTGDGQLELVAMGCGGTYVQFPEPPVIENNDQCAFPEQITVSSSCNPMTFSNVGYSASGEQPPFVCGSTGETIDSWFTVEVPPSGNVTIETTQVTGGLTDMVMQVLIGSCGAFTTVFCDDDDGAGNHSLYNLTNRTPGEIVYIRVIEYFSNASGEFGICAHDESASSCPPDYEGANQLTGIQSVAVRYESEGNIVSNQVIDADTDYDSGTQLYLLEGFEVNIGRIFHAFIDGCEGSQ